MSCGPFPGAPGFPWYAYPRGYYAPCVQPFDPYRLVPYAASFGQDPEAHAAPFAVGEPHPLSAAPGPAPPAPTPAQMVTQDQDTFLAALKKVTPTLLVVGIATGAAFAIGGGIVSHFVFAKRRG